jgi:predicted RNase H-like nuclease
VIVVGIDACRAKWLALAFSDGAFHGSRFGPSVAQLIRHWPEAEAIGIDIPIGLPDTPTRDADRAARDFVGARRSSVFPTFPRFVLEAATYEEAKELCVARGWPRCSIQSFGMRHRILEVAELAENDARVFEVHPEVSFRHLAGRELERKRTATGVAQRREALAAAGVEVPDLPYPVEDVLDAAVAAWSADRFGRGAALPLPRGHGARIGAIWR